jgi:hypothetical protein
MITIKAGDLELELFGSIKELPIVRHKLMQQYLLQDGGIGSDINAIDERISKLVNFLEHGRPDEAKEELTNLRYALFSGISGLDFKCRAFACFVNKINGEQCSDLSSDGITRTVEILSTITVGDLEQHWETVKKKLILSSEPTSRDGSELTLSTLIG